MAEMPSSLTVVTDTDIFVLHGRTCGLSAFSFIPPNRNNVPKERSYFNSARKEHHPGSRYDRQFTQVIGYNNKIHRDDREHAKSQGLTVCDEEVQKKVPTLSSSIYGQRLSHQVDQLDRTHARIGHVQSEFYRRNGVSYPTAVKF